MAKFSEVLTIVNGRNQKQVVCDDGKYPIYGSGGIMGYANDYICKAETVVIGRKGSINKPIFVETPFWNVDTAFGLCANSEKLNPKYLYYFCEKFDFEKLNTTVTIPSLTKSNLLNVEIPLPNLEKQKQIVELLDKVTSLIFLRKQQLSKLDELVKARFVEKSKEWKAVPGQLNEFHEGITYGFTNPMPDAEEGPWKVTAKDVVNGHINILTARKTTNEAFERLTNKSKPRKGDVLLTKDGTLGRVAVVDVENLCVNQSVAVMRCNNKIYPEFLAMILQMPEYQRKLLEDSGGGTIKHLYITKVDKMLISVPDLIIQKDLLMFAKRVDQQKQTVQQSLEKLELMKKALLQEYLG